jgi:hypothetical protein
MRESRRTVFFAAPILLIAAICKGAFGQQPYLVGTWEWTRKKNSCSEQYVFREDGTLLIRRGDERTENTYLMSWTPEPNGRYKLAMTTVKDDGGRDCADSTEDSTGRRSIVYILLGQSRETMILCDSPAGADCIGPLKRTTQ